MQSYDEYIEFYNSQGKTIDQIQKSKPMNEAQLKTKYKKYVTKENRKAEKAIVKAIEKKDKQAIQELNIDEAWEACKAEAFELDPDATLFYSALNFNELKIVMMAMVGQFKTLDPCHIIGRGRCPKMKYMVENILIAPRIFHHYIDLFRNPFTEKHETITEEQRNAIWCRIIGDERWEYLQHTKGSGV